MGVIELCVLHLSNRNRYLYISNDETLHDKSQKLKFGDPNIRRWIYFRNLLIAPRARLYKYSDIPPYNCDRISPWHTQYGTICISDEMPKLQIEDIKLPLRISFGQRQSVESIFVATICEIYS